MNEFDKLLDGHAKDCPECGSNLPCDVVTSIMLDGINAVFNSIDESNKSVARSLNYVVARIKQDGSEQSLTE